MMSNRPELIVPFYKDEMQVMGEYPGFGPGVPGTPIYKTPIQPHENVSMFLAGEKPLWMPSFFEFKMFNPRMIIDNVARGMVVEGKPASFADAGGMDLLGIDWEFVPEAHGSMVKRGFKQLDDISEWKDYLKFPDLKSLDWAGCRQENEEYLNDPRAIQMTVFTGLFERLVSMVGMEEALVALVDEDSQPYVHELFERLCEYYDELFYHMAKWFEPDLLWFHDDWGSQRAGLFSAETCEEMIMPYLKKVVESAHKYGIGFELHSCGKNEAFVPCMIKAGVDMWAGQPMNDKDFLYKEYGKDIKLGITVPPLPKDASDEYIRGVVSDVLDRFPKNVYLGMEFGVDYRYYPYFYEETRKRYNS